MTASHFYKLGYVFPLNDMILTVWNLLKSADFTYFPLRSEGGIVGCPENAKSLKSQAPQGFSPRVK